MLHFLRQLLRAELLRAKLPRRSARPKAAPRGELQRCEPSRTLQRRCKAATKCAGRRCRAVSVRRQQRMQMPTMSGMCAALNVLQWLAGTDRRQLTVTCAAFRSGRISRKICSMSRPLTSCIVAIMKHCKHHGRTLSLFAGVVTVVSSRAGLGRNWLILLIMAADDAIRLPGYLPQGTPCPIDYVPRAPAAAAMAHLVDRRV